MTEGMLAFYLPISAAQYLYAQVAPTFAAVGLTPLPPETYHLTLVYLDDVDPSKINDVVSLVRNPLPAITGSVAGMGRFENDGQSVIYASFDAVNLPEFRQNILAALQENGFGLNQTHGFTPHITLAYVLPETPTPDVHLSPFEITFPQITVAVGDNRVDIKATPMPHPILIEKAWTDENGDLHIPVRALPFYGPAELQGKDLEGDYFDPATDTGPLSEAIATFNHAKESEIFGELSGKYLGVAKRLAKDEFGWMYDLIVDRRNRYKDFVKKIVDEKLVDVSTTPFQLPAARSHQKDGYYPDWWIVEVTLTPQAANPNAVALIQKSLQELVMPEDNGSNPAQATETPTPANGGDLAAEIEKAFEGETETPSEGNANIADVIVALQKSVANIEALLGKELPALKSEIDNVKLALPVLGKQMAQHVSKSLKANVAEYSAQSEPEKAANNIASLNGRRHVSAEFDANTPGNW